MAAEAPGRSRVFDAAVAVQWPGLLAAAATAAAGSRPAALAGWLGEALADGAGAAALRPARRGRGGGEAVGAAGVTDDTMTPPKRQLPVVPAGDEAGRASHGLKRQRVGGAA